MKKKIIILIISIAVLSLGYLIYYNFFDTFGLVCLQDDEKIIYASSYYKNFAVVANNGNCYLSGDHLTNDANYGIEDIRKFNNYPYDKYVRIYDKGDAKSIKLNYGTGTIITQNNEVYAFVNGNDTYRTPTYICSGYTNAVIGYDNTTIYMLSENGNLVRANINTPNDIKLIGKNVKKFTVAYKNSIESILLLTNDNKLYIINTGENIENCDKYIPNITDFDFLVPYVNYCVLSLLDNNNNAYVLMDDYDITYEDIVGKDIFTKKVGENIRSVTSYNGGIVMVDDTSNALVYGSDLDEHFSDIEFHGEIVFDDVKDVFSGTFCLMIIKNNGDYYHYGIQPDATLKIGITP